MRKMLFASLLLGTSLFAADKTRDVVKEVFLAKYIGVVPEEEWDSRGGNGQIITTFSDGSTQTQTYVGGELNGKTITTYPNSTTPQKTEIYEESRLVSTIDHYPSGKPSIGVTLLPNGNLKIEKWFLDGTLASNEEHGGTYIVSSISYHGGNEESRVVDGEGVRVLRDRFGTLISKDSIAGGLLAQRELFYPTGELKTVTPYLRGQIHGRVKSFLREGQPLVVEDWSNGRKHGLTMHFENGIVISSTPYFEGKKHGLEKHLKDQTTIVEEISWDHGKLHGPHTKYVNGTPHQVWYHHDTRVRPSTWSFLNLKREV